MLSRRLSMITTTMNKFVVLVGIFGLATLVTSALSSDFDLNSSEWIEFKQKYEKKYPNKVEEITRATIFAQNKQFVDNFNANSSHKFKLAINHLADRTEAEYLARVGVNKWQPEVLKRLSGQHEANAMNSSGWNKPLPDSIDWRQVKGIVSPVRDQGEGCASGWAFAAAGALEGQELLFTKGKELIPLSVQNLIDCTDLSSDCDGGYASDAFSAIASLGGVDSDVSYPYEAIQGKCRFQMDTCIMTDGGYEYSIFIDENDLKFRVATYGPTAVLLDASLQSFKLYKTGIYRDEKCKTNIYDLNHSVLVVGYASDKNEGDYWIVKNSWGSNWGDSGYFKIARNANNMCGIASYKTNPLIGIPNSRSKNLCQFIDVSR